MDAALGIISTISFALAFVCAVACVVIFFRLQVRDAINFLRGKSVTAPSSKARGPRRDRSKKLAKGKKASGEKTKRQTTPISEAEKPNGGSVAVPKSEGETDLLKTGSESETDLLGADSESPTGLLGADSESPTGLLGADSEKPTGLLESDSEAPTGLLGADSEKPTGLLGADSEAETGLLSSDSEQPATAFVDEGEPQDEEQALEQTGIPCAPSPNCIDDGSAMDEKPQEELQQGVSIREGEFFFVSKQHILLVHTDEVIE